MSKKNKMGYIKPHEIKKRIHGVEDKKIQVGYSKKGEYHSEGDKWKDQWGKEWEVEDGITKSIPKFQDVRIPMWCPKCNSIMGKRSKDTEVYYKFGFCLDCLIERDSQMYRDGTFDDYTKKYMNSKKKGYYSEMKLEIEEYLKTLEKGYLEYMKEDGSMERWNGDIEKLRNMWEAELKFINAKLEKINEN